MEKREVNGILEYTLYEKYYTILPMTQSIYIIYLKGVFFFKSY